MSVRDLPSTGSLDLNNCEQEPIHIPGQIQPHGVLLAVHPETLNILQVSANSAEYLGHSPDTLLTGNLSLLLNEQTIDALKQRLVEGAKYMNPPKVALSRAGESRVFDAVAHYSGGALIIELEPSPSAEDMMFGGFYQFVRSSAAKLQQSANFADLTQTIATEVRQITGFDRVMVYRFDSNWNGEVIGEDKAEDMEPFLGLHYPASDIPAQARQLYTLNWIRLIADVSYQPVVILPTDNPLTGHPLDLTYSVLRSVSPVHIEYLKNMGVSASMSISLIKDNKLWGLISCHHNSAKYVSYEVRSACEFLGQVFSIQLSAKEGTEDIERQGRIKASMRRNIEHINRNQEDDLAHSLHQAADSLMEMVGAQGIAVYFDNQYSAAGQTPPADEVGRLIGWLREHVKEDIFATHSLSHDYPPAERFKEVGSGLLSLSISRTNYILWFRSEVIQTVNWSGNPQKAVETTDDGARLVPRKSFELWKETVRKSSPEWKAYEIDAAAEFRHRVIDIILRNNISELERLNKQLQRSNEELDAFAFLSSHDLKEPVRGIYNYANFMLEDYTGVLDEEGLFKLRTLVRLTERMEDLINALLRFSRLGRVDLSFQETDLNRVLEEAIDLLSPRLEELGITIRIPRPLPTLRCDWVRVREVFNNLITNAMKYNDKQEKLIEIGYIGASESESLTPIFYVRDNGIGIPAKHQETIFRIFKRLHTRDSFGGGTGVGLTMARRIIERHNGKIWLESTENQGTTFYFTLDG